MDRNLFLYWNGNEYKLILILRRLIYLHSTHGKGYKVNLITNKNILDYIPVLPDYFYQLCYAHQADFVRVTVICEYGGIWMDSDTLVIDSLDSLFNMIEYKDGFFIKENNDVLCNGIFGSKQHTPLLVEWKYKMMNVLENKREQISWCDIGSTILQRMYDTEPLLYEHYEILNGLDTIYPVNWNKCVDEFINKPYEHYKTLIRDFQPVIVLVNSVYKSIEHQSEEEIVNDMRPLNYFINKSYRTIPISYDENKDSTLESIEIIKQNNIQLNDQKECCMWS